MQPPPRKGNFAKFLKNLHSEQINKLLLKNQHECELLEDIRTYVIKKSAIEKSYSEALLKISSGYLNKKIPNIPDIKLEGGEEKWNMWNVWRTVLEENEKLARARLAAIEVFQQQIADDAKFLRAHKVQMARKCVDNLANVQKELQMCVTDVDKTKKFYFDEEHCAHDVRDKARDIEEKLKKKKGSFFQSITSLQKNSAKFSSKRDQLEEKSTGARNDYLLCLAAANAHQTRYFLVDLQCCMTTMESGVFDKVAEYLTLMSRTELLTCSAMQNSYTTIREQARQLTREYNLQCCYLYYPVLKQHLQYDFEPCDNDQVAIITAEQETAAAQLSKEARRWANRIARDNNTVKESLRKLQHFNALREAGQKTDPNDQNGPDLETKIEELKQDIRKAETSKAKAEARIECLRAGGVNVDEWLQEAETLNVQDIQRSTSSLSDHPSSDSFYDSDFADQEPTVQVTQVSQSQAGVQPALSETADSEDSQAEHDQEVDAMLEQERQRIEQLTAGWDDPTQVNWGAQHQDEDHLVHPETAPTGPLLKCTALYSYTAQNPDELTIVESEQLEVVGEGDGDGWVRARNYRGEEGYVPHNYLDVEREQSATTPSLPNQISFSSVDYTIDNEDESVPHTETNQSPEQISVISVPIQDDNESAQYCIAVYDYEGEGDEELTFDEGQIIKIVSKIAHEIDDGWWKGELEGRVGNFPSLVVEECDEYGEPINDEFEETPPQSAPPVFTPPDVPPHLAAEAEEAFSFSPGEDPATPQVNDDSKMDFSIKMTRDQHHQYGSQFDSGGKPIPQIPAIGVPTLEICDEDGADISKSEAASSDGGLGVAQIVITAATPMIEEAETPFPPIEEQTIEEEDEPEEDIPIVQKVESPPKKEVAPSQTNHVKPNLPSQISDENEDGGFGVSSSTGSEGETGPSTAENSISQAPPDYKRNEVEPKQVVGGRASIPDELEPHQLARLQDLKESNA